MKKFISCVLFIFPIFCHDPIGSSEPVFTFSEKMIRLLNCFEAFEKSERHWREKKSQVWDEIIKVAEQDVESLTIFLNWVRENKEDH